jgi:hypothetical protein
MAQPSRLAWVVELLVDESASAFEPSLPGTRAGARGVILISATRLAGDLFLDIEDALSMQRPFAVSSTRASCDARNAVTLGVRCCSSEVNIMIPKFAMTAAVIVCFTVMPRSVGAQVTPAPETLPDVQAQQADDTHPPTAHTGWGSLVKDTTQDFVAFPKRKSTWVILGAGAAAALATHPADDYVEEHIVGNANATNFFKLGKWVGSSQVMVGSAVGLWLAGRYIVAPAANEPRTNQLSHLGFDLMRAHILSQALVQGMKYSFQRNRPTGECCAFPSGHSAAAFAAAAVLERHMGYRGSWPALVGATYVAASRLVDNRHFLSDVVFGAAVGTTAGWTVVGRHGRDQYALLPTPVRGGMALNLTRLGN